MSALSQIFTSCPDIQQGLDTAWSTGAMIGADDRMPLLQYMTSDVNRQGVTQLISPGGGKVRNVQLTYMQRLTEDQVVANQANPNCGQGEDQGDLSTTYTLDTGENLQTTGFAINAEMLEAVCRDNGVLFQQLLQRDMDVLRRAVASEIADQVAVLAGGWAMAYFAPGNSVGNVNAQDEYVWRTIVSGEHDTQAWVRLWNALTDSGMGNNPLIIGGTTGREYFQLSQSGCCANDGLNLGSLFTRFGYAFAHDARLQKSLGAGTYADGANKAMAILPGALQLVTYTRSPWKANLPIPAEGANYHHVTIADPMAGLLYDWTMQDNCGAVTSNLTWTGKVIALPNDMFATGDPYEGVTGVAKITITNS